MKKLLLVLLILVMSVTVQAQYSMHDIWNRIVVDSDLTTQYGAMQTLLNSVFSSSDDALRIRIVGGDFQLTADGDTLTLDVGDAARVIEFLNEGNAVFYVDSAGQVYAQYATFDTVVVNKYFHEIEVAVIDSIMSWISDGDTLNIDVSTAANFIEAKDGANTVFWVDSTGDVGTTQTLHVGAANLTSPFHVLSTTSPQVTIGHTRGADSLDISVDASGYAGFRPSGKRTGFGTASPQAFFHINPELDSGGDQDEDSTFVVTDRGWVGIGTIGPTYELDVAGNIGINADMYHNDDPDTYLRFLTDRVQLYAGNTLMFDLQETSQDVYRINPSELDIDVSINWDSGTALYSEGSTGNVGIGTTDPDDLITGIDSDPVFTLTDSDVNLVTSTSAEQADSAAIRLNASLTEPQIQITQSTGKNQRVTYALEGWITHDAASDTLTLGVLPANAIVTDVFIWTQEAFNSDGTDEVCVGYTGTVEAYGVDVDVASTGVESVTLGTTSRTVDATTRTVQAYYHTSDATNLTTGEAHVMIVWIQATVNP